MSQFDDRWRSLARSARRAPETALPPPDRDRIETLLVRGREEAARPSVSLAGRAPGWALPAAAMVLLNVLALPAVSRAWTNTRGLENPLKLVPRAPTVPPPPVPTPPPVPRPPVSGSTEWLENLMKEMQP